MSELKAFDLDVRAFSADLAALGRQAPLVMARALNRAGTSGKTAMVKAVVADTGLRQKDVTREVQVDKATRSDPTVAFVIRGRRIPLIAFGARGPEPSRGRGRGVSYRLPTGRGRIPQGFIATMKSGHRGVFVGVRPAASRKGKRRGAPANPILERFGPSLPHVFEKFVPAFQAAAQESLVKNLRSEISFAMGKAAGAATE